MSAPTVSLAMPKGAEPALFADPKLLHKKAAGDAILDEPEVLSPRWGHGDRILMVEGEGMMIVGGQGVGKSFLGQQFVMNCIGVRKEAALLNLPIKPLADGERVLYLGMDRPRQILRSMKRMVSEEDRLLVNEKMDLWSGPVPVALENFADWVKTSFDGVRLVVIDSLKDLVADLVDGKNANLFNTAVQTLIRDGIDVVALHHNRKATLQGDNDSINSIYGSQWITAGFGSILMIVGAPGDDLVTVKHIKQAFDKVQDIQVQHDQRLGVSTALTNDQAFEIQNQRPSVFSVMKDDPTRVWTVKDLTQEVYGSCEVTQRKAVERELKKLETSRVVTKQGGGRGKAAAYLYNHSPIDTYKA